MTKAEFSADRSTGRRWPSTVVRPSGGPRHIARFGRLQPARTRRHRGAPALARLSGTSLRASIFHTNNLSFARSIRSRGSWSDSAQAGRQAFVDPRDVAAAAAAILERADAPDVVELPGPELLSYPDLAELLSAELGPTITYVTLPRGQFEAKTRARARLRQSNVDGIGLGKFTLGSDPRQVDPGADAELVEHMAQM